MPVDSSRYRIDAARVLENGRLPDARTIETLLTDGCAMALHLEAELRRIQLRREALAPDPTPALAERERKIAAELEELEATIAGLYAARARTLTGG